MFRQKVRQKFRTRPPALFNQCSVSD